MSTGTDIRTRVRSLVKGDFGGRGYRVLMRSVRALSVAVALIAALLTGCQGDATTKNDVKPGPTKGGTAPVSPGTRTPGSETPGTGEPPGGQT
jgi:hypothetical protein